VRTPAIVHVMGWRSQQYGSFERFLVALAARCAERGARTHLVFPGSPASAAFGKDVTAELHVVPSPRHPADPRFAMALGTLLRRVGATHLHAHSGGGADAYHAVATATALRVSARYGTKHIIPGSPSSYLVRARHRWLAARVRTVFAVSYEVGEALVVLGVPAGKVELCYLGVDPAAYRGNEAKRSQVRRELGVPDGSRVILTTSHLRPGKGVELLPAVTAELLEAGEDVIVLAAGDGPLLERLETQADVPGIAGRLRLLGVREDIPRLLAGADLFLFPSSGPEGLGLGPLEALAAGVPVVATEVSDLRTLLAGAAVLVPPGDAGALAAGCRRLLGDATLASSLRNRGLELVSGRLNVARAAEQHVRHYLS
jgi:glycosyltransferase involved in cell wall biosynthesis